MSGGPVQWAAVAVNLLFHITLLSLMQQLCSVQPNPSKSPMHFHKTFSPEAELLNYCDHLQDAALHRVIPCFGERCPPRIMMCFEGEPVLMRWHQWAGHPWQGAGGGAVTSPRGLVLLTGPLLHWSSSLAQTHRHRKRLATPRKIFPLKCHRQRMSHNCEQRLTDTSSDSV